MSYREWRSNNRRGKLLIYSNGTLFGFDKLTGSGATKLENVMVLHEDNETRLRQIIIAEQCIVTEDRTHVYMYLRGRIVHHTEPLSTRGGISMPKRERRKRRPIGIYNY